MDDPSDRYTALARHEERVRHEERRRREARAAAIRRAADEACRPAAVRRPRPTDTLVPPRPHSGETPHVPGPRPRALSLDDFAESAMAVVRPVPGQEVDLDLRLGPSPALEALAAPPPAREAPAAPPPAAPASAPPADWRAALRPATVLDAATAGPWTAYGVSTRGTPGRPRTDALALAPYGPGLLLALASGPAAEDACAAVYRHALRTAPALHEALRTRDAERYRRLGEESTRACAAVLADTAVRHGTSPADHTLRLLHVPVDDPGAPCGLVVLGASPGSGGGTAVLRPGGDWYETPATAARLLEGPHPGGALLLTTGRLPAAPATRARLAAAWAPGPPPTGPVSLLGQPLGGAGDMTAVVLWRR
ncbi:hypothetical protein [Streptomyces sp. NPDC088923]|uniref:hypothetical protein n=1 Tax=Streptomyces sp. NPDC088923 TaxID=3365913 RepID=UPI00382A327C